MFNLAQYGKTNALFPVKVLSTEKKNPCMPHLKQPSATARCPGPAHALFLFSIRFVNWRSHFEIVKKIFLFNDS